MSAEGISTLAAAKEELIPEDIKSGDTHVQTEHIRKELYLRAAGVTEKIVDFAERYPHESLSDFIEIVAHSHELSERQRYLYGKVGETISEERIKTFLVKKEAKRIAPEFIEQHKDEFERLNIVDPDAENIHVLGTILFFASTGKFPKQPPYFIDNPLFIKIHVNSEEDMKAMQSNDRNPGGFFRKEEYFEFNIQPLLMYHGEINQFLSSPISYQEKNDYYLVCEEIQRRYSSRLLKDDMLLDIISEIYHNIKQKYADGVVDISKLRVILFTMYMNCDIGINP